jgi:hypothetical protein
MAKATDGRTQIASVEMDVVVVSVGMVPLQMTTGRTMRLGDIWLG